MISSAVGMANSMAAKRQERERIRGFIGDSVVRCFVFNAEARNRPLRGFATHREANTPSGASAERRRVRREFYGCLRQS